MRNWLWAAIVVPGLLYGQAPRRGVTSPWWSSQAAIDLNLTDAQTKQIHATVDDNRVHLRELSAAVNHAEKDLEAAFNEDPVDQRKGNDAIERLVAARGDLIRSYSQVSLKMRSILTADQWAALQAKRAQTRQEKQRRFAPGDTPSSKRFSDRQK